jgi:hypothetical protein
MFVVSPDVSLLLDHYSFTVREDLKLAFDTKIDEMIKLMDGHIRQMHSKYPGDNIVGFISW